MIKHLFKYTVLFILISSCGGNENIPDDEQPILTSTKPSISMLLPNTGSIGDEIQVTGKNLGAEVQDITVLFGAAESTVKTVSKEKLTVLNPGK